MSAQTFSAGVLGCGRWGSFLCWYASRLGARVIAYEPKGSPALDELRSSRRNRYLELPVDVLLTDELERAVGSADMVLAAVPTCELRALSRRLSGLDLSRKALLLCMKGVEKETGQRLSQIVSSEGVSPLATIAWLGPGHPQDFVRSVPGCMLLVGEDESTVKALSDRLSSDLIRFYRSSDMIGCETGAAAKNVVGIAAGILDGLGLSSLKGPLMARAPQEVARLVSALGGDWRSVYGLSHLGDYEATLFSRHSRNRG
ncbi:hypothetical protein JW921_00595, partial [Candidatus Fermentibacterales bacterium]|nr:hypothetical protein [Candidatus Fermentibacterales bacterium]